MKNPLPTALAVPLLLFAAGAWSAPDQAPSHRAAIARSGVAHASTPSSKPHLQPLDLSMPNFVSPEWQRRLQGPTVDNEYTQMESVIVTPPEGSKSNLTVAPAGVGSLYWALMHPTESWRILMPAQPGDDFNTESELKLALNDPLSDCPGFRGTPNVRPQCN